MLGDRSGWLRDSGLFLLIALVPTTLAALLGLRAIRNEEAAVRSEMDLQLAQTTVEIRAAWQRGVEALDSADSSGQTTGEAAAGPTPSVGNALLAQPAAAPFAEAVVVDADAELLAPAGGAEGPAARPEPLPECAALASRIARPTAGGDRKEPLVRFLEGCELAQSPSGRWLWPVMALAPASAGLVDATRIEAWLIQHAGLLSDAERAETIADVQRSVVLDRAARARIVGAVTRASAPAPELRALLLVHRASVAAAGPRTPTVRWDDRASLGRLHRRVDGRFSGFIVHAASIARAVRSGWPPHPDDVAVKLVGAPGASPSVTVELLPNGLWLELAPATGRLLQARTRQARLMLWGLLLGAAVLSFGLTALLFARLRAERRLGALRTDFVAAVSHELRTPIASLRMLSELLEQGAVEPDEQPEVLGALVTEARRLGHTVDRLLTFSRMSSGRSGASVALVSLQSVLGRAAQTFRARHPEHDVDVDPGASALRVVADAEQLEMALDNLLSNAHKYAPEGTPYELWAERQGPEIWIGLRDHGPGVAAADRRRIFEPFERADDRLSRATEGSGIGLSLVRHVARVHGGRAWVESVPGEGATFFMALPYREAEPERGDRSEPKSGGKP